MRGEEDQVPDVTDKRNNSETTRVPSEEEQLPDVSDKRNNADFIQGPGGPYDYLNLMESGRSYLALPFPRHLGWELLEHGSQRYRDAQKLLEYCEPHIVSMLAGCNVGYGTDPERLEHQILNCKGAILDDTLFPTHQIGTSHNTTYEKVHILTMSSLLQKNSKIDFGLSGGYADVSLGFNVSSENSNVAIGERVFGIREYRYCWATAGLRVRHNKLYKYLSKEIKTDLKDLDDEVQKMVAGETDAQPDNAGAVTEILQSFFRKYGTHIVLKCSIGYRLESVSETQLSKDSNLKEFKAGLNASLLSYAKVDAGRSRKKIQENTYTASLEGTRSVGSRSNIEKSMTGEIKPTEWSELCAYGGDAGVISHDETMMIADVVRQCYKESAELLRYCAYVRVRDLQLGWNADLFAFSYTIEFLKNACAPSSDTAGVFITVEKKGGGSDSTFHEIPSAASKEGCVVGNVVNVSSKEVKLIEVSTCSKKGGKVPLKSVLAEIHMYRRALIKKDDPNPNSCSLKGIAYDSCYDFSQDKGEDKSKTLELLEPEKTNEKSLQEARYSVMTHCRLSK